MKANRSFWRKVAYLVSMVVLLAPLSFLSRPATHEDRGGLLAQMRADPEHPLSQAELGEIDPAGASMSLATLGMRGVAANILWGKALYYKKREDFTKMKATLNQIVKLQPNFVSVWRFQSWELSYNVAAEFDDYRHRYQWVKKGVDFLLEGIRYNRNEPMLVWDLGWFFAHKIGRSDDRRQFRQLYRQDDDFHKTLPINLDLVRGPDQRPDNWLTAWQWYLRAQQIAKDVPLRGKNPLIFHSDPAMALIYYAMAIEEDGYLDQKGQDAWRRAGHAWNEYGDIELLTSGGGQIRLNDRDKYFAQARAVRKQLDELAGGVRQQLRAEREEGLADLERQALETPPAQQTLEQRELADQARQRIAVSDREVAERVPEADRREALRLARRIHGLETLATLIDDYRTQVNFDYWSTRCTAEQQDITIRARRYLEQAEQAYDEAKLESAKQAYEKAWEHWAKIYQEYPILMDDPTAEDVVDSIGRYRDLLGKLDETFPPPAFKLHTLLEIHDPNYRRPIANAGEVPDEINDAGSPKG